MNIIWEPYGSREITTELCMIKKQNKIIFDAHGLNPQPIWSLMDDFLWRDHSLNAGNTVDDNDQHLFDDYLIFS